MARQQFPLSSDLLETLLVFEEARSLSALAEMMAKDPSVVSRNLQRIAEAAPVLSKVHGRWEITPLGRQINESTRNYLSHLQTLTAKAAESEASKSQQKKPAYQDPSAVLVVINAQNGLLEPSQGGRNNQEAEMKISKLLADWRSNRKPVLHIKHVSENPQSSFYQNSKGCEFLPALGPLDGELIIEKKKSSAFKETILSEILAEKDLKTLILTGFTANECIDATARDANDLGFDTFVVGDATAMFDVSDLDGKLIKAERVHRLTLANLNALSATVIQTEDLFSKA